RSSACTPRPTRWRWPWGTGCCRPRRRRPPPAGSATRTPATAVSSTSARRTGGARRRRPRPLRRLRLWARALPGWVAPTAAGAAAARAGTESVTAGRILADAADSFPTAGVAGLDGHDLSAVHAAAGRSADALARAGDHLAAAHRALDGPAGALLPPVSRLAR